MWELFTNICCWQKIKYTQFCVFCFLSSNHMLAPYHAMILPFRHIPKNNLRNTLSPILRCYIYLLQKAGNNIVFQEKISCSRHKEVWLQSTDKHARNLFFSENKVVLLMYKQNESGLINNNKSDMRYDSFFFHPHSKQANTPIEVPVWYANEKEEGDHWKIKQ